MFLKHDWDLSLCGVILELLLLTTMLGDSGISEKHVLDQMLKFSIIHAICHLSGWVALANVLDFHLQMVV